MVRTKIYFLRPGAALFYYKLGQMLLKSGAAWLLQTGGRVITNRGSYLFEIGATVITKWSRAAITY